MAPALLLGLGPEELRVLLAQLGILGNLGRRHRQEVSLRLEAGLVGLVRHRVGVAVVGDEGVGSLDVDGSRLGLGTGLNSAFLVRLKTQLISSIKYVTHRKETDAPGYLLEPFGGVEIHMEMDMEWKWMEMGHNL